MRLSDLMDANGAMAGIDVVGLSADSRKIEPGYLFAALSGVQQDGAAFIGDALERGAVAVLAEPDKVLEDERAFFVADPNPRRRLALAAARFYEDQPAHIVAVTGTNGKSSVADFVRQIWQTLGENAASMGTLGVRADGMEAEPGLTTPDPVAIHETLANLAHEGIDHLAMEASSHGLEQHRLDGVKLQAAAFTNLSRDHLDYHETLEDYFYAKLRLFGDVLPPSATAVLNIDCDYFERLVDVCWIRGLRILSVGTKGDLSWKVRRHHGAGQSLDVAYQRRDWSVELPLISDFQISNALIAAALVISLGAKPEDAFSALSSLEPVPGRMQLVGRHHTGATIYIDYAHTPDALETVLQALRPHTDARLQVVFGCGGDRDAGKRPMMGKIAESLADRAFVTDDNPRGEDPDAIRAEIMAACPDTTEIADRGDAIRAAIAGLGAGDLLVIAGKGHETGQIVKGEVLPFDDAEVIRTALAGQGGAS